MKIEMRESKHLWITYNPAKADSREIIVDEEKKDIRICDGKHIVKIRFVKKPFPDNSVQIHVIKDVLVDDVFVWQR